MTGMQWTISIVLGLLFAAEIAAATRPFAERGMVLLCQSLAHFAAMELTLGVWAWLVPGPDTVPRFAALLAAVYALVWGIRWAIWYFELEAIKEKLGLKQGKGKKEGVK